MLLGGSIILRHKRHVVDLEHSKLYLLPVVGKHPLKAQRVNKDKVQLGFLDWPNSVNDCLIHSVFG